MASKIQIKRSTGSTAPADDALYPGEFAYTDGLETLYLGSAQGISVDAGSFVVGTRYTILTVGNTDFQAIGASADTVGIVFTATGAGSGTGTAGDNTEADIVLTVGGKAYTDMVIPETDIGSGNSASIILKDNPDSNTNSGAGFGTTLIAHSTMTEDVTLTLPAASATANNMILTSTNAGVLTWDNTLDVSSVATAAGVTVGTTLGVTGELTASAAVTVGTTLGVTGATSVAAITATGLASLANVLIEGNLEVTGTTITIDSSDVVVKDKTMVLGVAGGMEEQLYTQVDTIVTVASTGHTFINDQYVYISGAAEPGTPITDGVYQVTRINDNSFTFVAGSDTVSTAKAIFHSSDDVTNATGNGSGIVVPNATATMASILYDGTNGDWNVSENIDLASGKVIKFAGTQKLSAAEYAGNAATVTLNADLTGDVTSSSSNDTAIAAGVIVDADVSATAAIAYSKLGTVPTWNQNTTGSSGSTTGSSGSTTGNAATATKLAAAVAIGGVDFDGSAAITLPGVDSAGDQDTSGNATTATSAATLTTARAIGGVDFDGSAAITLPGVNSDGNQSTSSTAAGLSATLVATSGGTGHSAYAVGDVLYASTTTAVSKLTAGTAGQLLMMGATIPEWSDIDGGTY